MRQHIRFRSILKVSISLILLTLIFNKTRDYLQIPNDKGVIKNNTKISGPKRGSGRQDSIVVSNAYPRWEGGRSIGLSDPRWKIADERDRVDPSWQGKIAIEFYGKVVDEGNQPVAGAKVVMNWTNLSAQGSSRRELLSDANGMFSITGIKGKHLVVSISKSEYSISKSKNKFGFEYAVFSDVQFHQADENKPVLFYLHKEGLMEPLVTRESEIKVRVGMPVDVQIDGQSRFRFSLLENTYPRDGKWEARVDFANGGILPANEEFITEAPLNGYQPSLKITGLDAKPPGWQLYQGGSFYMKVGEKYGRLDIEMIPESDWFRVKTWINPKEGSRNIEFKSGK